MNRTIWMMVAVVGVGGAAGAEAPSWPQWRGPTRDGVVAARPVWPEKLGEDRLKKAWEVEVGKGYSSPIVAGDRVFTVETTENREIVRAWDRASGKELWQAKWEGTMTVPFFAWRNGNWARCTPAYDGRMLYVGGMRDVLVCLDGATGAQIWRVDFMQRHNSPLPSFGFVSSPLVVGEHLYAQAAGSFIKLEKATGKTVWRTLEDGGGMWGSAFSSPMPAKIGGVEQLLVQTRTLLAGVEPETGKVLWSQKIPAFRGMNIINPVAVGDRVFTSSYGGGSFMLEITTQGEAWNVREAWKNNIQGYMGTPAVIDGHIYLFGRDQKLHCMEWATGNEKWVSPERFGEYCSIVVQGKMILALDQRGRLVLIRATPEAFDVVDRRQVSDEETWAHLAVCGGDVWVRALQRLTRWEWR